MGEYKKSRKISRKIFFFFVPRAPRAAAQARQRSAHRGRFPIALRFAPVFITSHMDYSTKCFAFGHSMPKFTKISCPLGSRLTGMSQLRFDSVVTSSSGDDRAARVNFDNCRTKDAKCPTASAFGHFASSNLSIGFYRISEYRDILLASLFHTLPYPCKTRHHK